LFHHHQQQQQEEGQQQEQEQEQEDTAVQSDEVKALNTSATQHVEQMRKEQVKQDIKQEEASKRQAVANVAQTTSTDTPEAPLSEEERKRKHLVKAMAYVQMGVEVVKVGKSRKSTHLATIRLSVPSADQASFAIHYENRHETGRMEIKSDSQLWWGQSQGNFVFNQKLPDSISSRKKQSVSVISGEESVDFVFLKNRSEFKAWWIVLNTLFQRPT